MNGVEIIVMQTAEVNESKWVEESPQLYYTVG